MKYMQLNRILNFLKELKDVYKRQTLMLSLPDNWKFNVNGLCLLCKESKSAVNNAIKELKNNKYLEVEKYYDESGRFIYEYIIYEYPDDPKGYLDLP